MRPKTRNSKKEQLYQLTEALRLNGEARNSDRPHKLSHHDLRKIVPQTESQVFLFNAVDNFEHVVANGSAGTGKSFLLLYHALKAVIVDKTHDKIIIVRSAVPCRDLGFLPGTLNEKISVYEDPYHGLCYELLGKATAYEHLKKANTVEFRSTSFLRGVTLNDTIVIFDEAQNASFSEINTLVTRLGENSRLFICADALQTDLKQHESGYLRALKIWESMGSFGVVSFDHDDIVRSEVVKDWIIKCSEM